MKLHAKNGNLSIQEGIFVPAIENSEYEVNEDDFEVEEVNIGQGTFLQWLQPGQYKKVTALVKVTRYYPIKNNEIV